MSVNLINKKNYVNKVSNINIVMQKARLCLDEKFDLDYSTRINKKFMIKGKFTNNKWVHFGDINYPDYTFTKDEEKRIKFLRRNYHWIQDIENKEYSPGWFLYHFLW
jgi:hypothetical protein